MELLIGEVFPLQSALKHGGAVYPARALLERIVLSFIAGCSPDGLISPGLPLTDLLTMAGVCARSVPEHGGAEPAARAAGA